MKSIGPFKLLEVCPCRVLIDEEEFINRVTNDKVSPMTSKEARLLPSECNIQDGMPINGVGKAFNGT